MAKPEESVSCYKVKIMDYNDILTETVDVYRRAASFFIRVCHMEWADLSGKSENGKGNHLEKLILTTENRTEVKYDFKKEFGNFPVYLRRAAIRKAIGCYSAYAKNLATWEGGDKKTKPPKLTFYRRVMPTLYNYNCYREVDRTTAKIKIFHLGKWKWLEVRLNEQDVKYIERNCAHLEKCVPTLNKTGKQWFLVFPFKQSLELNETPVLERTICSVDLGLNNNAVCTIMQSSGAILGRKFINLEAEKDHLEKAVGRAKKAQQNGAKRTRIPVKSKHVRDLNTDISRKTARGILDFALSHNADVIIFEFLAFKGKIRGSQKHKRRIWRKREIQKLVEHNAHRNGIRISRVCAWGTSKLAFDGSGTVSRKDTNKSICTFKTGKVYNCDLSASYNIGARYFVREILKSVPPLSRLPEEEQKIRYGNATSRTLSTLLKLNADLNAMESIGINSEVAVKASQGAVGETKEKFYAVL